ncbi:MAG: hypothetical protein NXY57DRAFT_1015880 [Lentinula lateritia]|nr:MAG: hypothetical protein NXY57DRAFT_1015880 [Lentinula lateritia]
MEIICLNFLFWNILVFFLGRHLLPQAQCHEKSPSSPQWLLLVLNARHFPLLFLILCSCDTSHSNSRQPSHD